MCVSVSLWNDKVEALGRTLDELNGKLAQEIGAKSSLQLRAVDLQQRVMEVQQRLLLQVLWTLQRCVAVSCSVSLANLHQRLMELQERLVLQVLWTLCIVV